MRRFGPKARAFAPRHYTARAAPSSIKTPPRLPAAGLPRSETDKQSMPTLAVDFDGTIAHYRGYAGRGVFLDPLPGAADALRQLQNDGWNIVVFTCRTEESELRAYLQAHAIPFDAINASLDPEMECSGKVYADVYLDDRAVTFRSWDAAKNAVETRYAELAADHALDAHVPNPLPSADQGESN